MGLCLQLARLLCDCTYRLGLAQPYRNRSASALGTDFSRVGELLPWKKSPLKSSDSNNLSKEPDADHANSTNFSHKTGDTYGNVVASLLDEARHRLEARFGDTPRTDGQGIEISSQRVESMGPMPSAR